RAEGVVGGSGGVLTGEEDVPNHRLITEAVHGEGGKILMQILHTGRYANHPECVAPSPIKSPISRYEPRELGGGEVWGMVEDFANCAQYAQEAGYDGVEIMGSEGYLISEFIVQRTNHRTDIWGGSYENRIRLPLEILRATRARVGPDFIIMFRLSMIDLVEDGSTWSEVEQLAQELEAGGATLINTGIGWHEARVPTIAQATPGAAWSWVTAKLRGAVGLPVVTSNRINTPELAEEVLARGDADMVSMARPFLADSQLVAKAAAGRADEINNCIACNQACLDFIFSGDVCTCLVNPQACYETELSQEPCQTAMNIAIVGAGPAGLTAAITAAERGHKITLFEAGAEIGGQLLLAKVIPGKEEFDKTLRYFRRRLEVLGVEQRLGRTATAGELIKGEFDQVILATGITARRPEMEGVDHPKVLSYADLLLGKVQAGRRVAIMGAGGIGFDVADFLTHAAPNAAQSREDFLSYWGIDPQISLPGGLTGKPDIPEPAREIYLLQRKTSRHGASLGKTTGWITRARLQNAKVNLLGGVTYEKMDDQGLHITIDEEPRILEVDNLVICAGQVPLWDLQAELETAGLPVHLIGGADEAGGLDARRAIDQGFRLASSL
ncbi:MAG: NADPH-dependent 2,4-dienoyl-CoA reductase, partial [Rhodospirillales bacterium]|nr:NADPH-dependent 2,4-dienoyl-CoA reductase [Rhodospirillales bacterium]